MDHQAEDNYNDVYEEKNLPNNSPLKEFLERYSDKANYGNERPEMTLGIRNPESLLRRPIHGYGPEKDNGWVTLDVVPWSISKVSKWESNLKPNRGNDWNKVQTQNQQQVTNSYKYFDDKLNVHRTSALINPSRPGDTPIKSTKGPWNKYAEIHSSKDICSKEDIITDGLPPNFPAVTDLNMRYTSSSETPFATYPSSGDGEWVLLSTTKGYKYRKSKDRTLQAANNHPDNTLSATLGASSSFKNSNVNKSVPHGDLIEVKSSLHSVNQVPKGFGENETGKEFQNSVVSKSNMPKSNKRVISALRQYNKLDSAAVIAAVGAGMIPATMAMLVPMAMVGKGKRSMRLNVN